MRSAASSMFFLPSTKQRSVFWRPFFVWSDFMSFCWEFVNISIIIVT